MNTTICRAICLNGKPCICIQQDGRNYCGKHKDPAPMLFLADRLYILITEARSARANLYRLLYWKWGTPHLMKKWEKAYDSMIYISGRDSNFSKAIMDANNHRKYLQRHMSGRPGYNRPVINAINSYKTLRKELVPLKCLIAKWRWAMISGYIKLRSSALFLQSLAIQTKYAANGPGRLADLEAFKKDFIS